MRRAHALRSVNVELTKMRMTGRRRWVQLFILIGVVTIGRIGGCLTVITMAFKHFTRGQGFSRGEYSLLG
jgi:hypothetical protein